MSESISRSLSACPDEGVRSLYFEPGFWNRQDLTTCVPDTPALLPSPGGVREVGEGKKMLPDGGSKQPLCILLIST